MQQLRILYQDEHFIAVEKPAGMQVHPSERPSRITAFQILKAQTQKWIFPVHRLDQATSGVLLFAFSSTAASKIQEQFADRKIKKTYFALVRGWVKSENLNYPLKKKNGNLVEAETEFENIFNFEIPISNSRFQTSRFCVVRASPKTGRYHQIRRHLKHLSHPIIGDSVYGDGVQNRIWRSLTKDQGLYLKAYSLELIHPISGERIYIRSRWNGFWQRAFDVIGFCPITKCELKVSRRE